MSLMDILIALVLIVVGVQFWRIRAVSEFARNYLSHYCDQRDLQLIAVARRRTKLIVHRGKLDWLCEYEFDFSGNGEDKYTGHITFKGLEVSDTKLPAYRVN